MHLAEGVLSAPVLFVGSSFSILGIAIGLKTLDFERMPQVAVLTAAFFIAALIHIPVGPGSVHLVLHGLLGIILGWAVFPAILVALLLQAILFGFGGLSVLGINVLVFAAPAVICFYLLNAAIRRMRSKKQAIFYGMATGIIAVTFSAVIMALCLGFSGKALIPIIYLIWIAHLPVMLVEGVIISFMLHLLHQLRPQLFTVAVSV